MQKNCTLKKSVREAYILTISDKILLIFNNISLLQEVKKNSTSIKDQLQGKLIFRKLVENFAYFHQNTSVFKNIKHKKSSFFES